MQYDQYEERIRWSKRELISAAELGLANQYLIRSSIVLVLYGLTGSSLSEFSTISANLRFPISQWKPGRLWR
jgi:hypothetical protein